MRFSERPSQRRNQRAAHNAPLLSLDDALTKEGASFDDVGGGRTAARPSARALVIACGALAREILAVAQQAGLAHVDVRCLPALLHNRPERIPPLLDNAIRAAKAAGYGRIFLGYGDCGTAGAIDQLAERHNVERLPGPHCYAFFEGVDAFMTRTDREADPGVFYLTDFLARQFDALVWRGLGLDRAPELRDAYFGHYTRLLYLAQTEDAALDAAARDAANRLDLAYERRYTGYGELETRLTALG